VQIGEQGVDAAVAAFQDALQLDPNHAPALAGLAMALVRRPWYASTPADRKRRYDAAMQAAGRASRIDPALAQAHEALAAVLRYLEFEWDKVIVESAKALELSPSLDLPHYNMAAAFYHLGLFDLADHAARAGLAANPKSRLEAVRNWGRTALYDSRFKHAEQWLVEVERVSDDGPRWLLGEAWYYVRDYKKSVAMLERLEASSQQVIRDRSRASLAAMLAARGDSGAAERRLKTFVAHSQPDHHVSHRIGTAYAQLRQPDRAVEWLRRAADTGFPCYSWFERDPLLDPIRTHPAFRKLLDDLRPMSEDRRTRFSRLLGVRF
jgi:adenylate cyclase